jgi:hypothetical protein
MKSCSLTNKGKCPPLRGGKISDSLGSDSHGRASVSIYSMTTPLLAFLVAIAAATARGDSRSLRPTTTLRSGSGSLWPMATLMDSTIADRGGSAHIVYVRSAFSRSTCLHVDLRGRGSHGVQRRACAAMAQALERAADCECTTCVITMRHSKGAAPTALPLVAKFVVAHRRHLSHVIVLEPRGVALKAVQIVKLLSAHDHIRIHRTWEAFELAADRGSDGRDQLGLQVARRQRARAAAREAGPTGWSSRLRDYIRHTSDRTWRLMRPH